MPLGYGQAVLPSNQVNAGAIQQQESQRQQFNRQNNPQNYQPVQPTRIEGEPPQADAGVPDSGSAALGARTTQIQVSGVSVYSSREIRKITKPYEGKVLTVNDLKRLVAEMNQRYYTDGYYTTQAFIPPQDFSTGVVSVIVKEGLLGKVLVEGNRYYRSSAIKRNLNAPTGEPLDIQALTAKLNQLNQQYQSQFRLKAQLKAGEVPATTDIVVQVQEKQPWQITPSYDNQGRPYIGTLRTGIELQNQSLTGNGDRLTSSITGSTGVRSVGTSYTLPVGSHGTELSYAYGHSLVNIDLETAKQPPYQSRSNYHTLSVRHPLDRKREFYVDASLNHKDSATEYNHALIADDMVHSLALGLSMNKLDRGGGTFARIQNDFAIASFGPSRKFWKTTGTLSRWQRLPKNNMLIFRGGYQLTPDTLPGLEMYQVGGAYSVHGYSEGLLSGDRGYNLGLEHRWPIPYMRKLSPWVADRVQGATVFDMGQAWLDQSSSSYIGGSSSSPKRTLLMGAGLGLRFYLTRFMTGFVDVGYGLTDQRSVEPNAQPNVRLHFGLRSNLLPTTFASAPAPKAKTTVASVETTASGRTATSSRTQKSH